MQRRLTIAIPIFDVWYPGHHFGLGFSMRELRCLLARSNVAASRIIVISGPYRSNGFLEIYPSGGLVVARWCLPD
jgi:hypothetical protein